MKNYFKAKLSCIDRIILDNDFMKLNSSNSQNRLLSAYITSCSEWDSFKNIFHSMKLTGLLMETTPGTVSALDLESAVVFPGSYQVGFLPVNSSGGATGIADASESIVLSTNQTQRKYISFNGGLNGWLDMGSLSNNLAAIISTAMQGAYPVNGGIVWTLKLTFYITFKSPK